MSIVIRAGHCLGQGMIGEIRYLFERLYLSDRLIYGLFDTIINQDNENLENQYLNLLS